MCLPLVAQVPLTVTRPELVALFPCARYLPDVLLDHEVPAPILSRADPVSAIHSLGELSGDVADFEALMAAVPNARGFVQPVLESRVELALLLEKIRFFDACWGGEGASWSTNALLALAVGAIPLAFPDAAAREELRRFFGEDPFPALDRDGAMRLLASGRERLRDEQRRLRDFWERKWQARNVVPHYLELYERA
jgi:hypothetical protein